VICRLVVKPNDAAFGVATFGVATFGFRRPTFPLQPSPAKCAPSTRSRFRVAASAARRMFVVELSQVEMSAADR
jgi:hypothetical protein